MCICFFERNYEIITENYFCVCCKNKRKHIQCFKLLFLKPNFHFDASNWISTCRKSNLLLVNSTYLIVSTLLMQRRFMQTKVRFKFCYSVRIEITHIPSKVVAVKKFFPQCVCYRCNLLRWMFFIPCGD